MLAPWEEGWNLNGLVHIGKSIEEHGERTGKIKISSNSIFNV